MKDELRMSRYDFMKKYSDVIVTFASYYKYKFYFMGILPDGKTLGCWKGGDAHYIYRLEVNIDPIRIKDLMPDGGMIKDGDSCLEWF